MDTGKMLIYYTVAEGGDWIPAEAEGGKEGVERVLRGSWDPWRRMSLLYVVGTGELASVHAVLFPSGEVWDSYHCRLRDGEAGYYEQVRELVGGVGQGE